ncbi:hypothetical protein GGD38_000540 [Chitinophagaceae bacterium OAS944]|nr:hypothetical protein [Chitinophagaceae bacterium OAS944]
MKYSFDRQMSFYTCRSPGLYDDLDKIANILELIFPELQV